MTTARRFLIALCQMFTFIALLVATTAAQAPTATTEKMSGEVVKVEGNNLVVKMTDGELRTFSNVPDSRKALIDGKEVGVRDLKPGTKLTATITRTTTPVAARTTNLTGKVWYVSATSVILTLPNGENKQYTVKPDFKFVIEGRPGTIRDLKPGMTVSAEKIVEDPKALMTTETKIVGQAPRP